jgi:hypothetical protein
MRATVEDEQRKRERALQAVLVLAKRHSMRRWLAKWRTRNAASTRQQRRYMRAMVQCRSKENGDIVFA